MGVGEYGVRVRCVLGLGWTRAGLALDDSARRGCGHLFEPARLPLSRVFCRRASSRRAKTTRYALPMSAAARCRRSALLPPRRDRVEAANE